MHHRDLCQRTRVPPGFKLAPIEEGRGQTLLLTVLVRWEGEDPSGPVFLLREVPRAQVYLGAICDADANIYEWVEVWVQTFNAPEVAGSNSYEHMTNVSLDQRWIAEGSPTASQLRRRSFVRINDQDHPSPVRILRSETAQDLAVSETLAWHLCKDDSLLIEHGLAPFSTSLHRYLCQVGAGTESAKFVSVSAGAPTSPQVQNKDGLRTADTVALFNAHAGLIRVRSFPPLALDDYLRILEGEVWQQSSHGETECGVRTIYSELRSWSNRRKGGSFLLHDTGHPSDALNEIFFLKLSLLCEMFKEARCYVKELQLPLLNLTPRSFAVELSDVGGQFPALWSARCSLIAPGDAHAAVVKGAQQRYFIRMAKPESSPYLPPMRTARSAGAGSVRIRSVKQVAGGTVLQGAIQTDQELQLRQNDMLWFRLPIEESPEFFAHLETQQSPTADDAPAGSRRPKEIRFITVPSELSPALVAKLNQARAMIYPPGPYEVWPLWGPACDLFSLAIIGVRMFLANGSVDLPEIVDEFLAFTYRLDSIGDGAGADFEVFKSYVANDSGTLDRISPHLLDAQHRSPAIARELIHFPVWLETIYLLLRLVPEAGKHSYCASFGQGCAHTLDSVFDEPIDDIEKLLSRLRSRLAPGQSANEEISRAIAKELERYQGAV
jgi:hypothetical protein